MIREWISHLWRITRWGWFMIYEVSWVTTFTNLDLIIGKYGSERAKSTWERLTHLHWGWKSWLIGALIIALLFIIDGAYRDHKKEAEDRFKDERRSMDFTNSQVIRKMHEESEKLKEEIKVWKDEAPKLCPEYHAQ